MDHIDVLITMTTHTVVTAPTIALLPIGHTTVDVRGPQPPAGAIAVGEIQVHVGGGAIPHAPQPPAGAIAVEEIQVHFGGEVIPHAPPPPVINHPNMVPNVPPDDAIMAGIQPEDPNVVPIMEIDEVDQRGRF